MEMMIPASDYKEVMIENERLRKRLDEVENENKMLVTHVKRLSKVASEKESQHVFYVGRGQSHPAYKKSASADSIIKLIHDERIKDPNLIADKLEVSYATVRRRLKEEGLFPINLRNINERYKALQDLGIGLW